MSCRPWCTLVFGLMVAACGKPTPAPSQALPAPVAQMVPATELPADVSAAFDSLQGSLKRKLTEAIQATGPAGAVAACQSEAPLATVAAQGIGLRLGRTSHALRNPANQAPAWAADWVAGQAGRKVGTGPAMLTTRLPGGGIGYLRVIGTAPLCLGCHGPADTLAPAVKSVLAAAYPTDRATGFSENEVRGWFWAERGTPPLGL